jgi:hypothetical protein
MYKLTKHWTFKSYHMKYELFSTEETADFRFTWNEYDFIFWNQYSRFDC